MHSGHQAGSPPQVRGKPLFVANYYGIIGITPAGAGKTGKIEAPFSFDEDHPRRCGENFANHNFLPPKTGSPPQVRGKLYATEGVPLKYRITPAGAGKTADKFACFVAN